MSSKVTLGWVVSAATSSSPAAPLLLPPLLLSLSPSLPDVLAASSRLLATVLGLAYQHSARSPTEDRRSAHMSPGPGAAAACLGAGSEEEEPRADRRAPRKRLSPRKRAAARASAHRVRRHALLEESGQGDPPPSCPRPARPSSPPAAPSGCSSPRTPDVTTATVTAATPVELSAVWGSLLGVEVFVFAKPGGLTCCSGNRPITGGARTLR
ncbi:unnamed protein product [Arctogadus glacialis]